jgi:ATP-dependent RNA circularization protein (DNA/RNA ligase family)
MTVECLDLLISSKEGQRFINALSWFQKNKISQEKKKELAAEMSPQVIKPLIELIKEVEGSQDIKKLMNMFDCSFEKWEG